MAVALSSVATTLIQSNLVEKEVALKLQEEANTAKIGFLTHAVKSKAVSTSQAAYALANAVNAPFFDISVLNPNVFDGKLVDKKVVQEHQFLPLWVKGKTLVIATSDPTDNATLGKIKFATSMTIEVIVVEEDKLKTILEKFLSGTETSLSSLVGSEDINLEVSEEGDTSGADELEATDDSADSPVVKFVNKMLMDAINMGASDLHFEPYEKMYRVRYRIDGVLTEIATPPKAYTDKIAARIKVMSRLNVSERRVPQDGRTKIKLSAEKTIDFRVSTCPMLHGEKIVMRILDPSSATVGIEALGYEPEQKAVLLDAVSRPYGMVLVTGPTGSGKTVSLYTCLNILNTPGVNISTAEDPAEINLPGINQVNVDDRVGLTFPAALKSFLRQDPDIIMVGEIRDLETADIAIKAASTGHMVLSTLHTNDAPQTLTRMLNMGVPAFNIASAVILITAQRLGRRLCSCKVPMVSSEITKNMLIDLGAHPEDINGEWKLFKAREGGCDKCRNTGYKGRVGIYQVMPITEAMQDIILKGGNSLDIERQAQKEQVRNLRQSGIKKFLQGLTSLDEILAVTNM